MAKKLQLTGFPRFSSPLTYGVSVVLNQIINVTDEDSVQLLALTQRNPVTNVVGPIWTLYVGAEPATYDLSTESNDKNFLDGSLMILPAQLALMTNKPPRGTLLRGRDNIPYGYSDGAGGYVPNAQALVAEDAVVARTRTWATIGAPADYIGLTYVTDIGPRGSLWRSDGAKWGIVGGSAYLAVGTDAITNAVNSTAQQDVVVLPIPANLLVAGSYLEIQQFWESPPGSAAKTPRVVFGSTVFMNPASVLTGDANWIPLIPTRIWAVSSTSQVGYAALNGGTSSPSGTDTVAGTENLATALNLKLTIEKSVGTDSVTLRAYSVKLVRP